MLDRSKDNMLYQRNGYTLEEELYNNYINMRIVANKIEGCKYDNNDSYLNSEEFKQGFLAGVKIMSSLFLDV